MKIAKDGEEPWAWIWSGQAARIHHSAPHSDKMPGPGLHSYRTNYNICGENLLLLYLLRSECRSELEVHFLIKLQSSFDYLKQFLCSKVLFNFVANPVGRIPSAPFKSQLWASSLGWNIWQIIPPDCCLFISTRWRVIQEIYDHS